MDRDPSGCTGTRGRGRGDILGPGTDTKTLLIESQTAARHHLLLPPCVRERRELKARSHPRGKAKPFPRPAPHGSACVAGCTAPESERDDPLKTAGLSYVPLPVDLY